jgi:2-phosphosulfolactate phosphatase
MVFPVTQDESNVADAGFQTASQGTYKMKIIRKSCAEGSQEAEGFTVIIDVFRAFTCAPLLFHFGAKRVILEANPEKALEFKQANPHFILVGEVNEVPMQGAELGNSPSHIILEGEPFFKDKTVIHRTTAGVTGVASAFEKTDQVILGSFVMAKAIAKYIRGKRLDQVTLVAMGERAAKKAPEDEACADYLESLLSGRRYDPIKALKDIAFHPSAQKFIQRTKEYLPREDPIFCLQRDLFDFVLTARRDQDHITVHKRSV